MKMAVGIVLLVSVCYNFVRFWEYKGSSDVQYVTVPALRNNDTYNTVYYSWMYVVTCASVSFIHALSGTY